MTEAEIRAEAAAAERAAHDIYAAMETARNALEPDWQGCRPLIPSGFEAKAGRASDLMRHVRALRADADEMRAEAMALAPAFPKLPAASVPAAISPNPAKSPPPPNPVDEVEAMAAAILASDQPAASRKCAPDVEALVTSILASNDVHDGEDDVEATVQAILGA